MDIRDRSARRRRRLQMAAAGTYQIQMPPPPIIIPPMLSGDLLFSANSANSSVFFLILMYLLTERVPVGRQLWTAHPQNEYGAPAGFWEREVLGTWESVRPVSGSWWNTSWKTQFRMEQRTFCFLLERYGGLIAKQSTHLRRTISPAKRLAIVIYYLSHGETFSEIAALFQVGVSTVSGIVHEVVETLAAPVTQDSIVFPVGEQLQRTMRRFEEMTNLPMCGGAVDGTFVRIVKPELYGDGYWCYKQHSAVLLFACVDSRGFFTFVDVGAPGSVGDAAVYNQSRLKINVENGEWLNFPVWQCGDASVRPFLIGDSAFSLSPFLMKIYAGNNLTAEETSFNYAQIRARRVVECAFGRLKERFHVVSETRSNDPHFASKAALLCCGLHNIIERKKTGHLPCLENHVAVPRVDMHPSPAIPIRRALANYLHNV
eukprot:scpid68951/ scgid13950/ Putative nuclease HARBI1; Harbinger transposase-derived nuclease